jgi:amino acid transporter
MDLEMDLDPAPVTTPPTRSTHDHTGPGLWIGLALGTPVIAWGIHGMLEASRRTHPAELARWIVGSALVHDLLVLPVVLAVAVVARRLVPPAAWPAVRWALATTGVLVLVSWPYVRGYGRRPSNPSLLPRSYGTGLLVALAAVWVVAVLMAWVATRRRRADAAVSR